MTVKDLINHLLAFPENAKVVLSDCNSYEYDIIGMEMNEEGDPELFVILDNKEE